MLRIQKILFPTDLSECAEAAFAQASFLAAEFGAELHVLNVIVKPHFDFSQFLGGGSEEGTTPFEWAIDVDREQTTDRDDDVHVLHRQVEAHAASAAIVQYAEEHTTDLIVMATHGRSGMSRVVLGSVTEDVIRDAPCPVLTVHSGDHQGADEAIRNILVPVDFSEHGSRALRYAVQLARVYGAEIDLLHAYEEIAIPDVYGVGPVLLPAQMVSARIEQALEQLAAEAQHYDVPIRTHVLIGHPALTVIDFADRHETDLIVLATHGWSGLKRLLLGSVAEKVIRMAPCPVFTVRSFGRTLIEPDELADRTSSEPSV